MSLPIDQMLGDVNLAESYRCQPPAAVVADLCIHVRALASEVETQAAQLDGAHRIVSDLSAETARLRELLRALKVKVLERRKWAAEESDREGTQVGDCRWHHLRGMREGLFPLLVMLDREAKP